MDTPDGSPAQPARLPASWAGLNVVAFIPHPDDESYSFGGLLALAAGDGASVHVVCATRGEGGERHDGGTATSEALAQTREAELRESCRLLGVASVTFWEDLEDGQLQYVTRGEMRPYMDFWRLGAHVVVVMGPDGAYGYPDHLALHRWVLLARAVYSREQPLLAMPVFPRGLFLPQYEKCVAAGALGDPPVLQPRHIGGDTGSAQAVDIRAVAPRKLAAIAAHRSQLPDGDPCMLFPPGIVTELLATEYYEVVGDLPVIEPGDRTLGRPARFQGR